jgi:hypothetical protein
MLILTPSYTLSAHLSQPFPARDAEDSNSSDKAIQQAVHSDFSQALQKAN